MEKIIIYTDGGCSGNPGPGGWAYVMQVEGHLKKMSGGMNMTTNNKTTANPSSILDEVWVDPKDGQAIGRST